MDYKIRSQIMIERIPTKCFIKKKPVQSHQFNVLILHLIFAY